MTRAVAIPGFRVKDGKVVRDQKRLDVSAQLRQRSSKRVKVARKGQTA